MSNRAEMAAVHKRFMSAVSRNDAAGIADLYTEEALAMYENLDFIKGRSAIQKFYEGLLASGAKAYKMETLELEEHGDTAYEVGKYRILGPKTKTLDTGKYMIIWRREGGQWKYHRDIAATSMPARRARRRKRTD